MDVALAIGQRAEGGGTEVGLIGNGSGGGTGLEPRVEAEVDGRRIAYGNVRPADIESLFDSDFLAGGVTLP